MRSKKVAGCRGRAAHLAVSVMKTMVIIIIIIMDMVSMSGKHRPTGRVFRYQFMSGFEEKTSGNRYIPKTRLLKKEERKEISSREKKLRIFRATKVLDFRGHWLLDGGGKIHETCLTSIFLLHEAQLHLQSCISSFNNCQSRHDYHESVRED